MVADIGRDHTCRSAPHQLCLLGAAQGLGEQDDSTVVTVLSPTA